MCGWDAKEPQMTQSTCQPCMGRVITQQSINIDCLCCPPHAGALCQKCAFFPIRHIPGPALALPGGPRSANEMQLRQALGRSTLVAPGS